MKRPTITDVAKAAGVSVATVDRVLNGRLPVREETSRRVFDAAEKIGFHATNIIRQRMLADLPSYSLGIILRKERHAFYQTFADEPGACGAQRPGSPSQSAHRICPVGRAERACSPFDGDEGPRAGRRRHRAGPSRCHCRRRGPEGEGHSYIFAAFGFRPGVREAYLGANNMKVGRTAAWMISRLARSRGKVLLLLGGHRFHGHSLRETGFRSYMREYAPEFEVMDALITLETRRLTYELVMDTIAKHKDLVGIYCVGGGMEGVIEALQQENRQESIVCLVNELTPESRQALLEKRISGIFQTPLRELCTDLVATMVHTIEHGMAETPGQRFVPAHLWVPESL